MLRYLFVSEKNNELFSLQTIVQSLYVSIIVRGLANFSSSFSNFLTLPKLHPSVWKPSLETRLTLLPLRLSIYLCLISSIRIFGTTIERSSRSIESRSKTDLIFWYAYSKFVRFSRNRYKRELVNLLWKTTWKYIKQSLIVVYSKIGEHLLASVLDAALDRFPSKIRCSSLEFLIIRLTGGCREITKPGVIELQPRKIGEDKFRAGLPFEIDNANAILIRGDVEVAGSIGK